MSVPLGWKDLPEDMEEEILPRLSLLEMARTSALCRSFRARYRTRMAAEQEARCKLAIKSFGIERIARIVSVITHHLEGESRFPGLVDGKWHHFWVSTAGVLQGPCSRNEAVEKSDAENISMSFFPAYRTTGYGTEDCLLVGLPDWRRDQLTMWLRRDLKGVTFKVYPKSDADLLMMAMIQLS
jgi:hypothetical protein